ncbi:MAG: PKD domain-containing protein, partial [Bacteroidota bacterium]
MRSITTNFVLLLLVTFFVLNTNNTFGQNDHKHGHESQLQRLIPSVPFLVYDADSLSGFSESAALATAIQEGFSEDNTQRYLQLRRREYIKTKYALTPLSNAKNGPPTVQAPCTNVDFETGTTAGWTVSGDAVIKSGAGTDPFGGFPVVCPGGSFSMQLGNNTNVNTSIANQTFLVTSANAYFVLKFAMVILNFPHGAAEAARVFIRFKDGAGNVIACPALECYYADGSGGGGQSYGLTGFQTGANGTNIGAQSYPTTYVPWTNLGFDLTPYIGTNVTVEIENRWCIYDYDWAYCYVDGLCSTLTTSVTGGCAGASTGTLTAPAGMDNYVWAGPAGSSVSSVITQTATTTTPGIYTVTCSPYSSCGTATYVYTLNFAPNAAPTADFNYTVTPCSSSFSVPVMSTSTPNGGGPITSYTWDWGDGTAFGTGASTVHTYGTIGTKTVELKVSNGACVDSITKTFSFSIGTMASFTNSSGCLNTVTSFSSTTTPTAGITGHLWDFGDGSPIGTGSNPTHTYTTAGPKVVTYTVVSASCSSIISNTITVFPNPVAAITGNTVCLGAGTIFGNTSSVAAPDLITGWAWDFNNDGTPDNLTQTPGNTYTTIGTYTVELRATTNNGCKDSTTIVVKVNPLPVVAFTAGNACVNNNVVLNNTSSISAPDNIQTYSWNFGAGATPATGSIANVTPLVYNTPGVKNITLNLTSNNSCTATATQTVQVNPSPVANFSATSVCQGLSTTYTDLSTPTGSILTWDWDFTNDGVSDNPTSAPGNLFGQSGTYTTTLKVTDASGCIGSVSLPVNVWGHTIPNFSPTNVCYGTSSLFTNSTNETANANTGTGSTYVWDFADNSGTSAVVNPSHTYTIGGNTNAVHNVSLTVTSVHGCVDFVVKPVNVYAVPSASFTSDSVCLGSTSHLVDASMGNGNLVNAYLWDFSMNGTVDVTGVANPNYIFPAFGSNSVSYTVSTSPVTGLVCSNTTNTIQVWVNPIPVPDFIFVNNCINAQPNTFNASPSIIAIGTNTAYAWAYGDGGVSTPAPASTTTHSYVTAGMYNVTLTLTSDKGCQATISHSVEVYAKPNLIPNSSIPCDGSVMTFTAVTQPNSGNITNWSWDLNGSIAGPEGSGQTIGYTYPAPAGGTHTISVVATTDHACLETFTTTVYVNYMPQPQFVVNDTAGCSAHCVTFTDLTPAIPGPAQIVSWTWTYGDGSSPIANNTNGPMDKCYVNNSSSQLANYDVQLQVTTSAGCTTTNIKTSYVTVYPTPIASYTAT